MLGYMYEALSGLMLRITLLLIVKMGIKFWARWTTATGSSTAVNADGDNPRSSGGPMLLQAEGMLTAQPELPMVNFQHGSQARGRKRMAAAEPLLIPANPVDRTQEVSSNLLSSSPQGPGGLRRNGELKVTCGGCSIRVAGAEREPFAEVFVRLDCTRSRMHTRVQLTLDQVDFGVRNCCTRSCSASNQQCDKNCKTVFIHKMTIQVRPKSWAEDCRRLLVQPHHTAEVFGLQRSSTLNLQMPLVCPRQASVSYQTGNTVSRAAPAFGWIPACRDNASNSVSWTWELYRYANGRKLEFNWLRWGSRPLLGIRPSYMHIHPGSFLAEASWELLPNAELQQQRLEWDVTVSLHTAVMQSQRRLPGYSVSTGPTLTFDRLLQFS